MINVALSKGEKYPRSSKRWEQLKDSVTHCLAMMPIYSVDKPGFCQMLERFDPKYTLPTHKHFSKVAIPSLYAHTLESYLQGVEPFKQTVIIIIVWKGGNWVKKFYIRVYRHWYENDDTAQLFVQIATRLRANDYHRTTTEFNGNCTASCMQYRRSLYSTCSSLSLLLHSTVDNLSLTTNLQPSLQGFTQSL